jgi:hypothetical protein
MNIQREITALCAGPIVNGRQPQAEAYLESLFVNALMRVNSYDRVTAEVDEVDLDASVIGQRRHQTSPWSLL